MNSLLSQIKPHPLIEEDSVRLGSSIRCQYDIRDNIIIVFGCTENKHIPIIKMIYDTEKKLLTCCNLHFEIEDFKSNSEESRPSFVLEQGCFYINFLLYYKRKSNTERYYIDGVYGCFEPDIPRLDLYFRMNFRKYIFQGIYDNWPKEDHTQELMVIIKDLQKDISELKEMIKYMPGSEIYKESKEHFENMITNI